MIRWIVIGIVTILIIAIAFIVAAAIFPVFRVVARDISIVVLAVFQMISAILTIALLVAVLYAVTVIRRITRDTVVPKIDTATGKLNEILDNTRTITGEVRDSSSTVSTTTVYVAERVVSPIIRISSLITGVRIAAGTLARREIESEQR